MAKLVQETWALVATDDAAIDAAGTALFKRIFELAPAALELFSFKQEVNMYESEKFLKHARSVITTVGVAVAGLDDIGALVPVLQALGKRHVGYGVQAAHYDVVGQALIDTLASGLGDKFTQD